MWTGLAAIALASWAWCLAVPRSGSALRGWPGAMAGLALLALGCWAFRGTGLGWAEAVAAALGLLTLLLPAGSALLALRRPAGRRTAAALQGDVRHG